MMDEMNEVHEFMEKIKTQDVETKWGLSVDPELKDQVKVTILATGFGVEDIDSAEMDERLIKRDAEAQKRKEEEDEEMTRKAIRRSQIYGPDKKGNYIRRPTYSYIFTDEDLDNDDIISMVETSPTYKRTKDTLKQFSVRSGESSSAAVGTASVITF